MANSKYEYVKSFEVEDEVMFPNLIVVRIDGCNFCRFSQVHEFEKPNDEQALNLMNACAVAMLEEYPDIVFTYGFSDEFSFVLKKTSQFYQRRARFLFYSFSLQFLSISGVNACSSRGRKKCFHENGSYLDFSCLYCHINNLYYTCFWMLVKSGRTEKEAQEILKCTQKQGKNEMLFQQFGINYKRVPDIFRQGSCLLRKEVEDIVKYNDNGKPVKRLRKKVIVAHSDNIAGQSFWIKHSSLHIELGQLREDVNKDRPEYIKSFQFENKVMPSTWIVVRIDGCHFHRFSEVHEFEKPNDEQALNLMNSCAVAVLEKFPDIVFSYGVSDEYSFVLKKESQFYQRLSSEIMSLIVSFFSSMYVMKWREFFPQKELKYPPCFDGRAVCYPSSEILRDYLAWRQVDCHINNQYNTCFWMLVKSGKTKSEAQYAVKGTQTREKNELLVQRFGIDYNELPAMFRQGSSVYREKEDKTVMYEKVGDLDERSGEKVIVAHCNIIDPRFWEAHLDILNERG